MNTFLLKINEPARKDDNIYIIQSNDIIKVGYTSNLVSRMMQYYYHNPNTIFIGSAYREDAQQFEKELHSSVQSTVLNEWYPLDILELLIEYVTGVTSLPKKIDKAPEPIKGMAKALLGKKPAFKDLCLEYIDTQDKDIAILYPIIKEAFDKLGAARMATLNFEKPDFIKELTISNVGTSVEAKVIQLFKYKVGEFVSSATAKERLTAIYADVGSPAKAKATDIEKYYEVMETKKKINGQTVRGFTIIAKKF